MLCHQNELFNEIFLTVTIRIYCEYRIGKLGDFLTRFCNTLIVKT